MSNIGTSEKIVKTNAFSKYFVLTVLFALPLVAYLFFLQGKHQFDTLPVIQNKIASPFAFKTLDGKPIVFKDSVTIVTFLGKNPYKRLGYVSNINEKIYKDFHKFDTFQLISILPEDGRDDVASIVTQMQETTDLEDWHFAIGKDQEILKLFNSFKTEFALNSDLSSDYAFIIDKNASLRGRDDTDDGAQIAAYDIGSIALINKVMVDDMRVILAEYRMALKKNRNASLKINEKRK